MSEELQQGSQPSSQPADGTNSVANEPVADTRQVERDRDYYNKTQALATDRRAVEDDRQRVERERAELATRTTGVPYQGVPGVPGYNQPYQGAYAQPQAPQPAQQPTQPDYTPLISQFGYEGAQAIVSAAHQLVQPIAQQFQYTQQQINQQQITQLETQISLRGKDSYGDEWAPNKDKVMEMVKGYGLPLELAWNAVTAGKAKQAGIDQAYQNKERKEQGNVVSQSVSPTQSQATVNNFGDAFKAAVRQHAS